ncbi:MAG: ABC transporter substrate-binding protein [Peptococcaceae bacterium]|jgi:iron complex transport system substrate-binding protein|nr:ABC transporter substrate-binding protein [Peptococcaceae bacterium]MDH7524934.1 ABC transporter substrate-binding protein [Peptococcaceae bacterium]
MRRWISVILVVCLMLSLFSSAGCIRDEKTGPQQVAPGAEASSGSKGTPEVDAAEGKPAGGAIQGQKENIENVGKTSPEENKIQDGQGEASETPGKEKEASPPAGGSGQEPAGSRGSEYVTFVDSLGETVRIKKRPQRVISLYNSYTNVWYSAGGEVIGRIDSTEQLTKKALSAEVCGSMGNPNVEKILSLRPDLVLLSAGIGGQKALIPILKQNNIPYMAISYENLQEYLQVLKTMTEITERPDLYDRIGNKLQREVNEILARVPKDKHPTVLLLFGTATSLRVRLPNTTVGYMLKDLGTVNIAQDSRLTEAEMQVFSMERILEKDPDFIFLQTMGSDLEKIKARVAEETSANPAWKTLRAVKEGRYIVLPKDLYLYKPNERYAEAYEGLARILYPEVFK